MKKTNRNTRKAALERQARRLDKRLLRMRKISSQFSWYRLIIFFSGLIISAVMVYQFKEVYGWISAGLALIIFNIVAYYHRRIDRSIKSHEIYLHLKETQLARMNLDWEKIPPPRIYAPDETHPFAIDVDLVGNRSIHQLIDISVSQDGSQRLADWLMETAPALSHIEHRQKIVQELTPLCCFRNKLLLHFNLVSNERLDGKKLLKWLNAPLPAKVLKRMLPFSFVLVLLNVVLFVLYLFGVIPPYYLISLTVYIVFYFMNQKMLHQFIDVIFRLDDELAKFRTILKYLEKYPYRDNHFLKEICKPFLAGKNSPARQLKKIKLVTAAIGLRMNALMAILLNVIFPWDFYFSFLTLRFRDRIIQQLPEWLDIWADLEALISLANFAYLNPSYSCPTIINRQEKKSTLLFEAGQMGHPLIPAEQRINNDFILEQRGQIALITGSNMAGKSTFLKTVGVNVALAYAGGPVNAALLKLAPMKLFTCIKISDSITDGFSYFYAEVRRLRTLLDMVQENSELPVLFLIDEIFKGTNNKERLIGSRSYVIALTKFDAIGLISTHDLELVSLADQHANILNYHFREEVVDGKMVFDYEIRKGPCPTTNALKIMQMEGLPVQFS